MKLQKTNQVLEGIEPSRAQAIQSVFDPMVKKIDEFEGTYNDIIKAHAKEPSADISKRARRTRLDIVKIRTGTEKIRKKEREEYVRATKAVDGVANIFKWAVVEKEEALKEIEEHFEKIEEARIAELQLTRIEEIKPFVNSVAVYSNNFLGNLTDKEWTEQLESAKIVFETRKQAKLEAEQKRKAEATEALKQAKKVTEETSTASKLMAKVKPAEPKYTDQDLMRDFIEDLEELTGKYSFKDPKLAKKYHGAGKLINKIVTWLEK